MVFGTIDLSEKSSGYKVHPIDDENTLWSKLFYAKKDDVLAAGSKKAAVARLVNCQCKCSICNVLVFNFKARSDRSL